MKFSEAVAYLIENPPNKAKIAPKGCGWPHGKYVYLADKIYVRDPSYLTIMPEEYRPTASEITAEWENV